MIGAILVFIYFLLAWLFVGRDPAPGRILPTGQPPKNMSPESMRALRNMGVDDKTFSVAIINMAIQGYLTIEKEDGTYFLVRTEADDSTLPEEEREMGKILLRGPKRLELTDDNCDIIGAAQATLQMALRKLHHKVHFKSNGLFTCGGVLMTVAITLIAAAFVQGTELRALLLGCLGLAILSWINYGVFRAAFRRWSNILRRPKIGPIIGNVFFSLLALALVGGELAGILILARFTSLLFALAIPVMVLLPSFFYKLLHAPTSLGRKLLDQIDSFAMYLNGDGLNAFADEVPGKDTARFEKYLPYAIALDDEDKWTGAFDRALKKSDSRGYHRHYRPLWYSHGAESVYSLQDISSSLTTQFSSALAAASTSPSSGSSGSGGGGSSGGGGGGGW